MGMILLSEYAEKHGRKPDSVRQKAQRGTFNTARKIGRQWFIDEDEPYSDARIENKKLFGKIGKHKHK